jgi:hypothetical protein
VNPANVFKEDRIVGILILIASSIYGWSAYEMTGLRSDDAVGPGGFPVLIAVAGIGLSAFLIARPGSEKRKGSAGLSGGTGSLFSFTRRACR